MWSGHANVETFGQLGTFIQCWRPPTKILSDENFCESVMKILTKYVYTVCLAD